MSWVPGAVIQAKSRLNREPDEFQVSQHPLRTLIENAVRQVPALRRSAAFNGHISEVAERVADAVLHSTQGHWPLQRLVRRLSWRKDAVLRAAPHLADTWVATRTGRRTMADVLDEAVVDLVKFVNVEPVITVDALQRAANALAVQLGWRWAEHHKGYTRILDRQVDAFGHQLDATAEILPFDAFHEQAREILSAGLTAHYKIARKLATGERIKDAHI